MSSDPIKYVLFNVDDTLFDHQRALRAGIELVLSYCPHLAAIGVDEAIDLYREALNLHAQGEQPENGTQCTEWNGFHVNILFRALNEPIPSRGGAMMYKACFDEGYMNHRRTVDHVREVFSWLKASGYQIAVVTKQPRQRQEATLRTLGLLCAIDEIFSTYYAETTWFVSPAVFSYAAAHLGVDPWNMVMVGRGQEHAEAALGALCKYISFDPSAEADSYVFEDRICFRAFKSFDYLPTILQEPDLINWRVSIETDETDIVASESLESVKGNKRLETPEPPPWSPITPKDNITSHDAQQSVVESPSVDKDKTDKRRRKRGKSRLPRFCYQRRRTARLRPKKL